MRIRRPRRRHRAAFSRDVTNGEPPGIGGRGAAASAFRKPPDCHRRSGSALVGRLPRDTALISERDDGDILELLDSGATRLVGTVPGVRSTGEAGLLGLAVDARGRLYAYSTGAEGNRVQRFDLIGTPGTLALGPGQTVVDRIPSASSHDGGRIAFGPDGMLYATVGDAGRSSDAQDVSSLGGKILGMTPDGDAPADNPFPGSLVFSLGHRNPQGIAWAADGTMFATEFAQNTWDELNVVTPGGNYGWPEVEGDCGRCSVRRSCNRQ